MRQRGFSLVSAMVAVAILGALAYGFASQMRGATLATDAAKRLIGRERVRNDLVRLLTARSVLVATALDGDAAKANAKTLGAMLHGTPVHDAEVELRMPDGAYVASHYDRDGAPCASKTSAACIFEVRVTLLPLCAVAAESPPCIADVAELDLDVFDYDPKTAARKTLHSSRHVVAKSDLGAVTDLPGQICGGARAMGRSWPTPCNRPTAGNSCAASGSCIQLSPVGDADCTAGALKVRVSDNPTYFYCVR